MTPEQKARASIDALLQQAGWHASPMNDAILAPEQVTEGPRNEMTQGVTV